MLEHIPLIYYALSGLFNFVALSVLGIFALLKNPKLSINRIFSIFTLTASGWGLFHFLWLTTLNNINLADFYLRTVMLFVIFMPATFTHFILTFLKVDYDKRINIGNYIITFIIGATVYTRLYAKDMGAFLVFPFWLKPGPVFHLHLLHFIGNVIYSHFLMFRAIKQRSGILRNQVFYVFIGTAIGYAAGVFNYFPWYRIPIPPFLNPLVSVYVAFITIAIIKYRLMDIKLARQYLIMNLFYGIVTSAIFIVLTFFLKQWFWGISVVIFLAVFLIPYFHRRMVRGLEPAFLGETYRRGEELDKLKESELGYIPEQVAWNVVGGVTKIMGIETASFFMLVKNRKEFRPQAQIGLDDEIGEEPIPWVTLSLDSPLTRHFSNSKVPLIKDELTRESSGSNSVAQEMQRLYAEISIPLFVRGELRGVLNLGPKENQEMYHEEDIKKLVGLCHQAENHLSHALFMEERASFSRELAHDMKNLFTKAVEPTVETILETKDPEKKEQEFKSLIRQLSYLKNCLKDNFDLISLLERIVYGKYILEPAQIARVISGCASLYKDSFAKAGISIEIDVPKNLPLVLVNREDIPKAFNNLFDNALKFTPSGGKIKIKAEEKEDGVLITFSDTGRGISEEDLKNLFEPKFKMPEEQETGAGLGLVIVKDIIEAHQGRIRVESEIGKGTSFYFTLPMAKEKEGRGE